MTDSARSQEERALWLLHASYPNWTPAPVLARVSLQYGRVIHGLRKKGWQIANKVEVRNGTKHGFFRLGSPVNTSRREQLKPQTAPPVGNLFDETQERQHRDDG